MEQPLRDRPAAPVLWIAVGLIVGVLLSLLVVPERQRVTRTADASGAIATSGTTDASNGESGDGSATSDALGEDPAAAGGSSVSRRTTGISPAVGGAENPGGDAGTTRTVKIGVSCVDLGPLNALEQYNVGNCQKQFQSALALVRREGLLPVAGTNIELDLRSYSVLDAESERASCTGFANDDKVFAVVSVYGFTDGARCLGGEFKVPVVLSQTLVNEAVLAAAPYVFSLQPSESRVLRNWVHWMDANGYLEGQKIGLYIQTNPNDQYSDVQRAFLPEFAKLGFDKQVVAQVNTDEQVSGPDDAVAVQRFRMAGATVAILLVNPIAATNFLQNADAQGYQPRYLATDFQSFTQDAAVAPFPAGQWDGTFAFTTWKTGTRNQPDSPEAKACLDSYAQVDTVPERGSAAWNFVLTACDLLHLLIEGIGNAGPDLTRATYVQGLEQVNGREMLTVPQVSFAPGKHDGGDLQKTTQWHRSCSCYETVSPFAALWVP